MLKYYIMSSRLYYKDEEIFHSSWPCIIEEFDGDEDKTKTVEFTWDNLEEMHKEHEKYDFICIEQKNKGREIRCNYLFASPLKVKEWRHKNLNLKLEIGRRKIENPSIERIFKYSLGDVALQYLKERL